MHTYIPTYTQSCFALVCWLSVFVIYGCCSEQRMTFWTALYFAVSAISTGSAQSLAVLGPDTPTGNRIYFDEFNQVWCFDVWHMVVL